MAPPPAAAPDKRLAAVNLGINFAAAMAVLGYLGYRYDQWRGGGQGGTLTGLFLGLIYGGYEVWKVVRTPPTDSPSSSSASSFPTPPSLPPDPTPPPS